MTAWKEELKFVGRTTGYYLLLLGVVICWVTAIVLSITENSLWVILGFFILGTVFYLTIHFFPDDEKEAEQTDNESSEGTTLEKSSDEEN